MVGKSITYGWSLDDGIRSLNVLVGTVLQTLHWTLNALDLRGMAFKRFYMNWMHCSNNLM